MPMEIKKTYVGRIGSYDINVRLSPPKLTETRAFLRDKVMYTALLDRLGLPTARTQAVAHKFRHFGDLAVLRDPQAVAHFLREAAIYPLFAKPCEGAASVGSALIEGLDGDVLRLGNGARADLDGFAHEVMSDYPEGFIFQSAIDQHPDMAAASGASVGTLRVVTVRDEDGASVLYAVWKIPSPTAMSDNFWQSGSMLAEVDAQGRVGRCKKGVGLSAEWIKTHPLSGVLFEGMHIPHWDKIQQIARQGHMLFPEFGIVGWDIAVGKDGPVIVECNDNPYQVLYQQATGQGMNNTAFALRLNAAAARSEAMLHGKVATFQAREKAKRHKG